MVTVIYMVARLVSALVVLLQIAMFVRAILSWIPGAGDSAVGDFLAMVTEPVIAPIRALADRFGWFRNSPLDFSFIIAYLLLSLLGSLLASFTEMFF
jgi:YggT family protein